MLVRIASMTPLDVWLKCYRPSPFSGFKNDQFRTDPYVYATGFNNLILKSYL